MMNYVTSKYEELRAHAENNILQNGRGYMWYISMVTLGLLVYVIYSYVDSRDVHVNLLYAAAIMMSANAYIINTMESRVECTVTPPIDAGDKN